MQCSIVCLSLIRTVAYRARQFRVVGVETAVQKSELPWVCPYPHEQEVGNVAVNASRRLRSSSSVPGRATDVSLQCGSRQTSSPVRSRIP
jgi:hypothetical protein